MKKGRKEEQWEGDRKARKERNKRKKKIPKKFQDLKRRIKDGRNGREKPEGE